MPATRTRASVATLLVVAWLHGMVHTYASFLSPLNQEIQTYFRAATIGAVTSFKTVYLLVYAASNLAAGVLATRMSGRRLLAGGIALNGLAVIGFTLVPRDGMGLMYAMWALAGLGGGVYHPVAIALVSRLFNKRKGWAIGITGVGAGLGFSFGPIVSGLLAGRLGLDWRQIAVLFGIAGLAAGAVALFAIPDPARESPSADVPGGDERPPASPAAAGLPARRAWLDMTGPVWLLLGMIILMSGSRELSIWTILDISAFFLNRVAGPAADASFFLFLFYFPAVFIQPFIGTLSDRVGRVGIAALGTGLYALSIAGLAIAPPGWLWLPYLLMGICMPAVVTVMEALVADIIPENRRAIFFGIYITAGMGAGALGPLVFGLFIDGLGGALAAFSQALLVMAGLVMTGVPIILLMNRLRRGTAGGAG